MPEGCTKFVVNSIILESISTFYKDDPERVFFEYIDNSLDSAEKYYDHKNKTYTKNILIKLDINTRTKEITITDNCDGINDLNTLITSIGLHQVHGDTDHGQFGYGVFSFPAISKNIQITTKNINKTSGEFLKITIDDIRNGYTKDPQSTIFLGGTGTEIVLSNFVEKKFLKNLNLDELKDRIERHLEGILQRGNLKIQITKDGSDSMICKKFDYDQYQGRVYEKVFQTIQGESVRIYLKVLENKQIDRHPFFVIRGREIESIYKIPTFKTKNMSTIWKHPNLIGYIDLGNTVRPNLARNGLRLDAETKRIFNKIIEFEYEILEIIQAVNKLTQNEHYKKLENKLTSVLSKLARLDNMKYRAIENNQGGNGSGGGEEMGNGVEGEPGTGGKDYGDGDPNTGEGGGGIVTGDTGGVGPSQTPGGPLPGDPDPEGIVKTPTQGNNPWLGGSKHTDGFSIKFEDIDVPEDDKGNKIRSSLVDGEIIIYKNHPDFIERTKQFNNGNDKITQRLITYLAGEITVHYKDTFHNKHGQPQYNKGMFIDLVEFIYEFEKELQDLVGQNLADI